MNSDASQGTPMYVATYSANPDIKMAITDHGGLTASLPTLSCFLMELIHYCIYSCTKYGMD